MYIDNTYNVSTLSITWTPPSYSSQCVSSYSVLSNVTDSTITTTDTSVDIPLAGLSPGVYCVSVATVDTANRTGNYSDEECEELNGINVHALASCAYYNYNNIFIL